MKTPSGIKVAKFIALALLAILIVVHIVKTNEHTALTAERVDRVVKLNNHCKENNMNLSFNFIEDTLVIFNESVLTSQEVELMFVASMNDSTWKFNAIRVEDVL